MPIRRSSKILIAVGVLFVIGAATIRLILVPSATKLPASLDSTAQYEGTANLLNAQALESGDTANAIAQNVPITIDRRVYVSSTSGDTAIVHDDSTMNTPSGAMPNNHTYALDRSTLDSAPAPAGIDVEEHTGITISLPLRPAPSSNYQYYDPATRTAVPMNFIDTSVVSGREVHNYTIDARGPLADPAVAGALPPALPKALLNSIMPLLPANVRDELGTNLETLADPVPLTYTADTKIGLSADTTTGAPLDATLNQQIIANVDIAGKTVSLLPVSAVDAELTDTSIADAVANSTTASSQLRLIGVLVPVGLAILGVLCIAVGWIRRHPKSVTVSQPVEEQSIRL